MTRGHWVSLPVDDGNSLPPLEDGEDYLVRLRDGEVVEAVGRRQNGACYVVDGEPQGPGDVEAVWVGELPKRGGEAPTEAYYAFRGQEQVKLRVAAGYKARLKALAAAAGLSLGKQVEAWVRKEEATK